MTKPYSHLKPQKHLSSASIENRVGYPRCSEQEGTQDLITSESLSFVVASDSLQFGAKLPRTGRAASFVACR